MTEKIEKLPKWAQEHIRDLQRQRDEAVRTLNRFVDDQTESRFFIEEHPCIGEGRGPSFKRRYIQAQRAVGVKYEGHDFEIGFDNLDRLNVRSNTGRLILEMQSSNTLLLRSEH